MSPVNVNQTRSRRTIALFAHGVLILVALLALAIGIRQRSCGGEEAYPGSGHAPLPIEEQLESGATVTPDELGVLEMMTRDASTVAEVTSAEIYAVRAMTDSGIVPTRDPALPPHQDYPSPSKRLYAPVRLQVLEYYKGALPGVEQMLVPVKAGSTADFPDVQWTRETGIAASNVEVGARAMVFVSPIPLGASRLDYAYIRAEAERLSSTGSLVGAFQIVDWYRYFDNKAASWWFPRSVMSTDELRSRIQGCVASNC